MDHYKLFFGNFWNGLLKFISNSIWQWLLEIQKFHHGQNLQRPICWDATHPLWCFTFWWQWSWFWSWLCCIKTSLHHHHPPTVEQQLWWLVHLGVSHHIWCWWTHNQSIAQTCHSIIERFQVLHCLPWMHGNPCDQPRLCCWCWCWWFLVVSHLLAPWPQSIMTDQCTQHLLFNFFSCHF